VIDVYNGRHVYVFDTEDPYHRGTAEYFELFKDAALMRRAA